MRSLFIVDDSPLIIERLLSMLEGLLSPERIAYAGSYVEALSLIDLNPPDILLLDVHLPDRSGVELLRVVRKRYPAVTVIMISNQSDESYRSVRGDPCADPVPALSHRLPPPPPLRCSKSSTPFRKFGYVQMVVSSIFS